MNKFSHQAKKKKKKSVVGGASVQEGGAPTELGMKPMAFTVTSPETEKVSILFRGVLCLYSSR